MPSPTFARGVYLFVSLIVAVGFTQAWPPRLLLTAAVLPMPCLALYFHVLTPQAVDRHKVLLLATLALGTLVDGMLTFYGRTASLYAVAVLLRMTENLLLAYLMYSEMRDLRQSISHPRWGVPRWVLVWVVAMTVVVLLAFWQGITSFRAVLLPYVVSLVLLTLSGINRIRTALESSFQQVLIGIVLFIFSNFISATDRFLLPLPYPNALSFATYAAGFYLIVHGFWLQYQRKT